MTLRVQGREATLLDVLDRLLDKGIVVSGDLTISVAEVDLIFASLRLVVTSVDKMWEVQGRSSQESGPWRPRGPDEGYVGSEPVVGGGPAGKGINSHVLGTPAGRGAAGMHAPPQSFVKGESNPEAGFEPEKAANGLDQLVITLADLIRKLLEREALRRIERGTLAPWEIERLGQAFLAMEGRMQEVKKVLGLRDEDLNLDLGPLGKLM